MDGIEEAVDLSNRGSREDLHQPGNVDFGGASAMVAQNNRLGLTMQQNNANGGGFGGHSAMAGSFQARPIGTSTSNMMHHNPNNNGLVMGTEGNLLRASHNSKGSLTSQHQTSNNHF